MYYINHVYCYILKIIIIYILSSTQWCNEIWDALQILPLILINECEFLGTCDMDSQCINTFGSAFCVPCPARMVADPVNAEGMCLWVIIINTSL